MSITTEMKEAKTYALLAYCDKKIKEKKMPDEASIKIKKFSCMVSARENNPLFCLQLRVSAPNKKTVRRWLEQIDGFKMCESLEKCEEFSGSIINSVIGGDCTITNSIIGDGKITSFSSGMKKVVKKLEEEKYKFAFQARNENENESEEEKNDSKIENLIKIIVIGEELFDVYCIPKGTECTRKELKTLNYWTEMNASREHSLDNSCSDNKYYSRLEAFLAKHSDKVGANINFMTKQTIVFSPLHCG